MVKGVILKCHIVFSLVKMIFIISQNYKILYKSNYKNICKFNELLTIKFITKKTYLGIGIKQKYKLNNLIKLLIN